MAKLKALITTWHVPHQYDMITALQDYVQFDILINSNKSWKGRPVPVPEQTRFVWNIDQSKYDYAIINIDQQCINPVVYKAQVFEMLRDQITDIPVFVLQHGSPVYPEFVGKDGASLEECQKRIIEWAKEQIGDRPMILNSYEGATDREWGWGIPIVHGMDSDMWKPAKEKEPRIITSLSPGGCDEYYNRAAMGRAIDILDEGYGFKVEWARVSQNAQFNDHQEYADWLASSLVYIDTSIRTPMNRARTEAMLSGCCVVQMRGAHDVDRFFKDGENIVLVDTPEEMAEVAHRLATVDYDKAVEIGKRARINAIHQFNYDRYSNDWLNVLENQGILNPVVRNTLRVQAYKKYQ